MTDRPFQLLQIDHVVLRARDMAATEAFYCGVLGCQVERRLEKSGMVQLRAGNSLIDLVDVAGPIGRAGGAPPGAQARNMDHLCLRADPFDRDAIVSYLQARGVRIGEFGVRYGAEGEGPSQYLFDPEGNMVELKGPPDEVPIDTASSSAST